MKKLFNDELSYVYQNEEFLKGQNARPIRILGEYIYPNTVFEKEKITDTIVFFGSARIFPSKNLLSENDLSQIPSQNDSKLSDYSVYFEDALKLAKEITQWGTIFQKKKDRRLVIVTGGGPGIMEAANRGAKEGGGDSIGLNIQLPLEPDTNSYVTKSLNFKFQYFFMRKFWFLYFARALVVFPGGFGTLDELFETLTLQQTKHIKKRIPVFLFGKKFWNRLIDFSFLCESGMISKEDLNFFHIVDSIPETMEKIKSCFPTET